MLCSSETSPCTPTCTIHKLKQNMQLITNEKPASASHLFLGAQYISTKHAFTQYLKIQPRIHIMFLLQIQWTKTNMTNTHIGIQKQKHVPEHNIDSYGERSRRGPPKAARPGPPEGMSFTLVRDHKLLVSETSIWRRLTASNAVNYHVYHAAKTCAPADLCTHDNNRHGAHTRYCLITSGASVHNLIKIWQMEPEHASLEDPVCHKYVCSFVARFLPGRTITKSLPVVYSNPCWSTSRLVASLGTHSWHKSKYGKLVFWRDFVTLLKGQKRNLKKPGTDPRSRIVQCTLSPLKRI